MFDPYEKMPTQYAEEFTDSIGVSIRARADIVGVSKWSDVSRANKQACQESLLVIHNSHFLITLSLFHSQLIRNGTTVKKTDQLISFIL